MAPPPPFLSWPPALTLLTEFRVFVEAAERQLLGLFRSIDRDRNGKLDKDELYTASQRAGIAIPARKLHEFFEDIDHNKDGFITYEEWRYVYSSTLPLSPDLGTYLPTYLIFTSSCL